MYQDSLEVDIDVDRDEVERVSSSAVTGRGEADLNCAAARKIVYLKTHKVGEGNSKHFSSFILYFRWQCASSTLQNIMFRFGEKNNLTFVLPNVGGNLGGNIS